MRRRLLLARWPAVARALYLLGAAAVVVTEAVSVLNGTPGDTVTEGLRRLLGVAPVVWYAALGLWLGMAAWATLHIFFGRD